MSSKPKTERWVQLLADRATGAEAEPDMDAVRTAAKRTVPEWARRAAERAMPTEPVPPTAA